MSMRLEVEHMVDLSILRLRRNRSVPERRGRSRWEDRLTEDQKRAFRHEKGRIARKERFSFVEAGMKLPFMYSRRLPFTGHHWRGWRQLERKLPFSKSWKDGDTKTSLRVFERFYGSKWWNQARKILPPTIGFFQPDHRSLMKIQASREMTKSIFSSILTYHSYCSSTCSRFFMEKMFMDIKNSTSTKMAVGCRIFDVANSESNSTLLKCPHALETSFQFYVTTNSLRTWGVSAW